MKYLEIYKNNISKLGCVDDVIKKELYIIWDDVKIKEAFNFGKGTKKDFNNYMNSNKNLCKYIKIE